MSGLRSQPEMKIDVAGAKQTSNTGDTGGSRGKASGRGGDLFGEEVVEGFYGGEFVVFDVEDGV